MTPGRSAASPRVSVVIPAFNAEPFIESTLVSAQRQTFRNLEIIVVDDGSSDRTSEVVRRAAATDDRVRLIVQHNQGLSASRNHGVHAARGELIAFLDHDDIWHPEKLSLQVALLDAHPDAAVASCYSAVVDDRHRCLGWRFGGMADGDVYSEMLRCDIVSGGSVAIVRRAALDAVGPFDEALRLREDWDMWIRLARRYPFATVPRTLVGYTRQPLNASKDHEQMVQEGETVLASVSRLDRRFRGRAYRYCRARDRFAVAGFCAVDGQTTDAWRYLFASVTITPLPVLLSPRRWGFVGALALQTVLPARIFHSVLAIANRWSFRLPPGLPFADIAEPSV